MRKGQDQVLADARELPPDNETLYTHSIPKPVEVHQKLAAIQIVKGLMKPELGVGDKMIVNMLPKKQDPPTFIKNAGTAGWGIHAQLGFSVWRFIVWVLVCFIASTAFIIAWLVCINSTDLQNAFVPATTLTTVLTISLAVIQLWEQ